MIILFFMAYIFIWVIITTIALRTKWSGGDDWLAFVMGFLWPLSLVTTLAIGIGLGISKWING